MRINSFSLRFFLCAVSELARVWSVCCGMFFGGVQYPLGFGIRTVYADGAVWCAEVETRSGTSAGNPK